MCNVQAGDEVDQSYKAIKSSVQDAMKMTFKPEFLNRWASSRPFVSCSVAAVWSFGTVSNWDVNPCLGAPDRNGPTCLGGPSAVVTPVLHTPQAGRDCYLPSIEQTGGDASGRDYVEGGLRTLE